MSDSGGGWQAALQRANTWSMDSGVLIALVVGGAVLLVLSILFAAIPVVWYLVGAVCLFNGLIGPGLGCLVIGVVIHLFHRRRVR